MSNVLTNVMKEDPIPFSTSTVNNVRPNDGPKLGPKLSHRV